MKNRPDFVQVRLTAAGRKFAGESQTIRHSNAHSDYTFVGAQPQEVLRRGEWSHFLSRELVDGEPMYEIADDTLTAADPNDSIAEEASTHVE